MRRQSHDQQENNIFSSNEQNINNNSNVIMTNVNPLEVESLTAEASSSSSSNKLHNSPLPLPLRRNIIFILFATVLIFFLVVYTHLTKSNSSFKSISYSSNTKDIAMKTPITDGIVSGSGLFIEKGTIAIAKVGKSGTISYYHCGPKYNQHNNLEESQQQNIEMLLLHGAAFSKENWLKSGLLDRLCTERNSNNNVSVTAVDLPVNSDGKDLNALFTVLVQHNIISGRPLSIVSPSASGKSIVSLAEYAKSNTPPEKDYLTQIVHSWIPVASGSVLKASEETLYMFKKYNIPILAMNGNEDEKGRLVTKRLVQYSNAEDVEIQGGHPCYFDSPNDFILLLFDFIEKIPMNFI